MILFIYKATIVFVKLNLIFFTVFNIYIYGVVYTHMKMLYFNKEIIPCSQINRCKVSLT